MQLSRWKRLLKQTLKVMIEPSEIKLNALISVNNIAQDVYDEAFLRSIFKSLKNVEITDEYNVDVISEYVASNSISYKALAKQRDLTDKQDAKIRGQIDRALTLFSFVESYTFEDLSYMRIEDNSILLNATLTIKHTGRLQDKHIDFQEKIFLLASGEPLFNISKSLHDHKEIYWLIVEGMLADRKALEFIKRSKFLNEISVVIT